MLPEAPLYPFWQACRTAAFGNIAIDQQDKLVLPKYALGASQCPDFVTAFISATRLRQVLLNDKYFDRSVHVRPSIFAATLKSFVGVRRHGHLRDVDSMHCRRPAFFFRLPAFCMLIMSRWITTAAFSNPQRFAFVHSMRATRTCCIAEQLSCAFS